MDLKFWDLYILSNGCLQERISSATEFYDPSKMALNREGLSRGNIYKSQGSGVSEKHRTGCILGVIFPELAAFFDKKAAGKQFFIPPDSLKIMYLRVILIAFLAIITVDSHAQFWKKNKKVERQTEVAQPTSKEPSYSNATKEYAPKASRKSSKGPTYGLEKEYYERMADLEKTRRKNERLMEKPQYSNPMYFGHKHPPKKRKPSKMKYCKVCGIRH